MDPIRRAIAEFARGLMRYVQDGNVVEIRDCGFIAELEEAMRAGGLDEDDETGDFDDQEGDLDDEIDEDDD